MLLMTNCVFELFKGDFITVVGLWDKYVLPFFRLNGINHVVVEFKAR